MNDTQLSALVERVAADPHAPTSVRDPARIRDVHIADSLSGLEVEAVRAASLLVDIGSGAGFPGLVLAVALPSASVVLVESSSRKAAFAEGLAEAVGLSNVSVEAARVEEASVSGADVVTARALAALPMLVEYAAPLLRLGGSLVAWKGVRDSGEEEAGAVAAGVVGLEPRSVLAVTPFAGARNRHLHVYEKVAETPARFPRRPGVAVKRPLGVRAIAQSRRDAPPLGD